MLLVDPVAGLETDDLEAEDKLANRGDDGSFAVGSYIV
jgi:hypothetical protein